MSRTKRILVVDDDPRNRKLVETLLRAEGYETHSAASGTEGLAAAARAHPDLILLDLMMPDMDGFEVVRHLKADARLAPIPVVLVSALDDDAARVRLEGAGAAGFLTKPIDRWALKSRVEALLGGHADDRK